MASVTVQTPECCVCDKQGHVRVIRSLGAGKLWRCERCQIVFYLPLPPPHSPSAGERSVQTDEGYSRGMLSETPWEQSHRIAGNRYATWRRLIGRQPLRILEIGCGGGELGGSYSEIGAGYLGIDIDDRCIDAARKRLPAIDVRCLDFFDLSLSERFDVVTFSQVLEHITEPRQFVRKVFEHLMPGGVVHCDVPSQDGLAARVSRGVRWSRARWGAIEYPHHLFAYRAVTLEMLFSNWFSVGIQHVAPDDGTWGQVRCGTSVPAWFYYRLSCLIGMPSLLVLLGQKM